MNKIRGVVVAVLLAVCCFPAVSSAKSLAREPAPLSAAVSDMSAGSTSSPGVAETARLATREQQAPNLRDFKGGSVVVYASSGAVLVAVIVLLVLLV